MLSQETCQWICLASMALHFLILTHHCFNGRKSEEPTGTAGFVVLSIALAFGFWIRYTAGLFTTIFQ